MDQTYALRATEPGARLSVHIDSRPRGGAGKCSEATLPLRRREPSRRLTTGLLALAVRGGSV